MRKDGAKKAVNLKTLTKVNVWDITESDIFRMWETVDKNIDLKDNTQHYIDILRTAFEIEELPSDDKPVRKKYEALGYAVGAVKQEADSTLFWAVKKRQINRVTDLTHENIHHISAEQLVEVLRRNFGGGWDSLSQSIQDIIESAFFVSTTTLPQSRLHKPGGTYDKNIADGYVALEVPKGGWTEAIFVKLKPEAEKPHLTLPSDHDSEFDDDDSALFSADNEEADTDDTAETADDDEINEDNYSTMLEIEPSDDEAMENASDYDSEE